MDAVMINADICVIGAGSGGLSVAAGAAQLGLKTVLIERAEMGGDCLNTGCVPSKALLAAAKRAQSHRKTDIDGVAAHQPAIDFSKVKDHVFAAVAAIAPHDSQERFEGLGVTVLRESARFTGPRSAIAGKRKIKARHFVIAAGSRPAVPKIPGLDEAKVLTNETIFKLREKPEHLLIVGGGPIGIEMAQAHARLGCRVTVIEQQAILPRDDEANVDIVRAALADEGVEFLERAKIISAEFGAHGWHVLVERSGEKLSRRGSHLLVATGRKPNVEGLGLEAAEVAYDEKGVKVDARLRTTNRRIFAIGDIAGGPQFTHVAGYHAGVVLRNVCFKLPAKVDYRALPWVTYCEPELAQVGLTEAAAREKYADDVRVVEWPFTENDRAITEGEACGRIRIIARKDGALLGASMVGPHVGELIGLWALAISAKMKLSALTGMIAPYPTLGEISKRAAGAWFTPRLFSERTRTIVRILRALPI
jgi:pyruvate/2-oxoglutarate dehydrogenase complex dihydrolipoamide dehydrogenase (E3) component